MKILHNIAQLATCRAEGGQGDIHAISDAAMVWDDGVIEWVGPEKQLPAEYRPAERLDAGGRLVIPGLVDCHTHLAFAGWRADEFEQRIRGRGYLEIARDGGGIMSTVRQTRAAAEADLLQRAAGFLQQMLALGVTTVECKSGYGLDLDAELKLLRVYRRLAKEQPVRLAPTFLGAHIIPPEFRDNRVAYVDLLVERMIPAVAQEETEWGLMLTTTTSTGRVQYLHYGMPNVLLFKESDRDHIAWRVPIDDEHHASFQLDVQHIHDGIEGEAVRARHAARTGKLGRSPNELGAAVLRGEIRIQDLEGDDKANIVWVQDYAVQVGQGPIELRKYENLGRSDMALILQRKIWVRELQALADGKPLTPWTRTEGLAELRSYSHVPEEGQK